MNSIAGFFHCTSTRMAGSPYQASLPAHREGAPLLSRPNALCTSLIATAGEVVAQLPDRDLRAAVLFGSVAWGDADEASDLDLMLLLDQPAGYREVTRLRVADLLGRPLPDGPRFIDLDRRSAQTFEEGEGRWFQRIAEQRLEREADPLVPRIETCLTYADAALATSPADPELLRLHDWLTDLLGFVRLFDRAVRIVARADSNEIARGFGVLARLSDESLDRLLRLFGSLPEEDLAATIDAVSRVSPSVARKILSTANKVARLGR